MTPLINILIRTNGKREEAFKRCLQSVLMQTHKTIRIIVSYDCTDKPRYIPAEFEQLTTDGWYCTNYIDAITVQKQPQYKFAITYANNQDFIENKVTLYVEEYDTNVIKVQKQQSLYGYNLYCNDLKSQVTDGYLLYLDDDDILVDNKALERIVPHLSEDKVTVCQMIRGERVKPRNGEIESGKIGMPCFLIHAKHKDIAMFDNSSNADYRFIAEICSKLPYEFVPIVVVRSDKRSYGA